MADTIKPITGEAYGEKSWRRFTDYRFAASSSLVRLASAEISRAALAMPLAFAQADGKPAIAALLGFVQGQNLFVTPNGRWAGRYVPAALRGWPFQLAKTSNDRLALCFNESSGLLVDKNEGEAFFGADGKPSEAVRRIFDFLVRTNRSQAEADAATALLARHGLLEHWPLKVGVGDQERAVDGLLRVNEAALNGLNAEALTALRKGGALAMAYAQLLSMGNVSLLNRLAAARAGADHQARVANGNSDSMKLFKPVDHGQGMIDWKTILDE